MDEWSNWLCGCIGWKDDTWQNIFPTLQFQIDETVYDIPITSYIMPYTNDTCIVELHKMEVDYFDIYIFGLTFMENYYSVYDMENGNGRVGMAISNVNKLMD